MSHTPYLYAGSETIKARDNFPSAGPKVNLLLVKAIVEIKLAAAKSNQHARLLTSEVTDAIIASCQTILRGELDHEFDIPAIQGGAGTSINMNVNEVIANYAKPMKLHPLDHVNLGQSTNDVNPSGLRIASLRLLSELITNVEALVTTLEAKSAEFTHVPKLGRTHLQDAVPTTLGAEFASYAAITSRHLDHLKAHIPYLQQLNLGGTAIGNGVNANPEYTRQVYVEICKLTGMELRPADNLMALTSSSADFVNLSATITSVYADLSKIATDLRILSSGPRGGLGEINLPALQAGSSIMPGKLNPVMPELINQIYFLCLGHNLTIITASEQACLELAIMFPVLAHSLLESLQLAVEGIKLFTDKCVSGISANPEVCEHTLEASLAYATLLTPNLGYDKVSELVKSAIASGHTLRQEVLTHKLLSEEEFNLLILGHEY